MRRSFLVSAPILLGLLSACVSIPRAPASPPPGAQTHVFKEQSYDSVFRAIKQVMRREGCQIREDDGEAGRIVASLRKPDDDTGIWEATEGSRTYQKGDHFEIVIGLDTESDDNVRAHMTFKRIEEYSLGGKLGRAVVEPKLYSAFYEKVSKELEQRKTAEDK